MNIKVDPAFITGTFVFNGHAADVNKIDVNDPNRVIDGNWMSPEVQTNAFKQLIDSNKFTVCELRQIQRLDQYDFYQRIL